MVYLMSKSILVTLRSNFQDKFSGHELTCLECMSAIVCHTFQIKGSQDGQCLWDAGSCWGPWLAPLSTGRADSVGAEPEPAGLLPVWLHGHIAESIHCQHLNNVAFSRVAFSFPRRSAVNEKGCQSLSG